MGGGEGVTPAQNFLGPTFAPEPKFNFTHRGVRVGVTLAWNIQVQLLLQSWSPIFHMAGGGGVWRPTNFKVSTGDPDPYSWCLILRDTIKSCVLEPFMYEAPLFSATKSVQSHFWHFQENHSYMQILVVFYFKLKPRKLFSLSKYYFHIPR